MADTDPLARNHESNPAVAYAEDTSRNFPNISVAIGSKDSWGEEGWGRFILPVTSRSIGPWRSRCGVAMALFVARTLTRTMALTLVQTVRGRTLLGVEKGMSVDLAVC